MKLKKLLSTLLTIAMLMTLLPAAMIVSAETEPIVFTKDLLPIDSGQPRKIKLEAYTTGSTSSTQSTMPADIILVLDQSGSMDDTIGSQTKLEIMKNAVTDFASEVKEFNAQNNDFYRLAIVGFASESGYNDNTEILTVYGTQTITNTAYTPVDITTLDTDNTYYIADGDGYTRISYYEASNSIFGSYQAGWYTLGLFGFRGDYVNIQSTTVYVRTTTTSTEPVTTPGVAYADLTDDNYAAALVDCTGDAILPTGTIGKAINQIDSNGATRTDLGMNMAANIFDAQPAGTYQNRKKIVVVITDGVPTTASDFSSTVANNAVMVAKELKDEGAHIFSMYLGTPSSDSVNFLQALSSNYPEATAYNNLGTQAANSYYSAHTQSSAITNVFHDIAFSIISNSTLDEKSVVTDTISEYFRLPAVAGGVYDTEQISVYTVDMTASGWATEEKPFEIANVTIDNDKNVKVTGFNFAYHCVTETPKDTGGTDYGRKLVIYIPIVEDESADTFGGYLPTNAGAGIYQDSSSTTATITAGNKYDNVTLKYNLLDEEHWRHIDTGTSYTFEYTGEFLNDILKEMIPEDFRPDGNNNLGVTMKYTLTDLMPESGPESVIATFEVSAGEDVFDEITNFDYWTLEDPSNTQKVLEIVSGNHAETMYRLDCVLTNKNDSNITLTETSYLDIEVVNENVHLVGGVIDAGGSISVEPAVVGDPLPGEIIGNTYREEVTEGEDSAIMTFTANPGYEISRIVHITTSEEHENPLDEPVTLYDITDETNNDASIFEADGSYIFQAVDVEGGQAIEVYTRPIVYTLTTESDEGSIIMDGTTYSHHNTEILEVFFRAHSGYSISGIEVNGHPYSVAEMLLDTNMFHLQTETIAGTTYILEGDVHLPKTQDHDVKVASAKRSYNLTYKYYKQEGNTYSELSGDEENFSVIFGADLTEPSVAPGTQTLIGTDNYTLRGWYSAHNGSEFYGLSDVYEMTMPASDLVFHAFWEKNPDITVNLGSVTKNIKNYGNTANVAYGSDKTFTFKAVFNEHEVGTATITLGASDAPASTTMSVTLTDAQNNQFASGRPIYLYEVHNSADLTLLYDDIRYAVYYDGTIKNAVTNQVETDLVFANRMAPYLVNYDLAGGNIGGNATIAPRIVGYTESNLLPTGTAVKAGYDFAGWKKDTTVVDNSKTYSELAGATTVTAITLVAQWTPKNYTVHYDLAGGTLDTNSAIADSIVQWEDANLLPAGTTYAKPSHTFAGWKMDTVEVDNTKTYADLAGADTVMEITLVAQWTYSGGGGGGTTKYTLTYETNGGNEIASEKYSSGAIVKLSKVPRKDGYVFEGWYLDDALTEDVSEVKMTKNITVYAAWVEDNGSAGNGHKTPDSLNGEDHFAYVVGYPDGTVKPNDNISRAEVTSIFFRLLKDEIRDANLASDNIFNDTNGEDWFNTAVSTMAKLGIVKGRYTDKFVPNAYITRAEFAAICARFDNSEFEVIDEFTDVNGHWAEAEIHEAAAFGWIRGYEDGTFKPDQFITRAEAMTMINRVLNRVPETADDLLADMIKWPDNSNKAVWYYLPVQEATNSHDYDMKNHIYEKWTALQDATDWTKYE